MGISLLGTLWTVLLQFTPADMWQPGEQLTYEMGSVIVVDLGGESSVMPLKGVAIVNDVIQVNPLQLRVRVLHVEEVIGNVRDGYTLRSPAPT
jgi:hypothetical protein